jgi:ribosome-binding factor A
MSKLTDSLAKTVNKIISPEIIKAVDPEHFGLCTVTGVIVTRDFDFADVYVSVWQNKEDLKEVLRENVYQIQQVLNKAIRRKKVPKIRFFTDDAGEFAEKVEKYLRS